MNWHHRLTLTGCLCIVLMFVGWGWAPAAARTSARPRLAGNHAPKLNTSGSPFLSPIAEDAANNAGTAIAELIASVGALNMITDADSGAREGLAITDLVEDDGSWQFTLDGATWLRLDHPTAKAARLLAADSTTRVRFVPNLNFNGLINPALSFRAWDQTSGSNGAVADTSSHGGSSAFSEAIETASIAVGPDNDPPNATDDTAVTEANTPRVVNLLGNDSDPNGDPLGVVAVDAPAHGSASTNGITATYTPLPGFAGTDVFTATIGDGQLTDRSTVTVTVGLPNHAPLPGDDATSTLVNVAARVAPLQNDADPDGDTLALIGIGAPSHGAAVRAGATIVYTPAPGFAGVDRFTYTVSDGMLSTAATVRVNVVLPSANPWEADPFDNLALGCLDGQNGWARASADMACPAVTAEPDGRALTIDPAPGTTIAMLKDTSDQTSGRHTFVLRVKVAGAAGSAPLAKIEVRTAATSDWDKKFQLYFGGAMQLNTSPYGSTTTLVGAMTPDRWYHVRGVIDLDRERLDVWVDGRQVADGVSIYHGPIAGLALAGWDQPGAVMLDDLVGFRNAAADAGSGFYWINGQGGMWGAPANWSQGKVPGAADQAFIMLEGAYTVTVGQAATVGSLAIGGPASSPILEIERSGGPASLAVKHDLLNLGTVVLESSGGAYGASLTAGGVISNTGVISVTKGAGGSRALQGALTNLGVVSVGHPLSFAGTFTNLGALRIAAGQRVSLDGATQVFNQNSGGIAGAGGLELANGATLNFARGTIEGTPLLTGAVLAFAPAASGRAAFVLRSGTLLRGDIGAEQGVWVRADSSFARATAAAPAGFTNAGTIWLDSANGAYAASLAVGGRLTNTGVISVTRGTGGSRTIGGALLNQGTLSLKSKLALTGAFTSTGTLQIDLGPGSGDYAQLLVANQAALGGTLALNRVGNFNPARGASFKVLDYGARLGEFWRVDGRDIGNGKCLGVGYGQPAEQAGSVTLTATTCADQKITRLAIAHDGPTQLGKTTTLSATVASGNNIAYQWSFGDGAVGGGAVVRHTYQLAKTYTVVVTATNLINQATATATLTVFPEATLTATVGLQARPAKPNLAWSIPLTVTLTPLDPGLASYSAVQTTDQSGTLVLRGLMPGRYDIRVKGAHTLRNLLHSAALAPGANQKWLGLLLEGDVETAATANQVMIDDAEMLRGALNSCAGEPRFVANADLDGSGCVTLADFGLLSGNFNRQGDVVVTPAPAPAPEPTAVLRFTPEQAKATAGEVIHATVDIDPRGAGVNGATVQLQYNPAAIDVLSVQLTDQLPFVFTSPTVDHQLGIIQFSAGLLGTFTTQKFAIATVSLRLKAGVSETTTISAVVNRRPATEISGRQGNLLGEARPLTISPVRYYSYLPLIMR